MASVLTRLLDIVVAETRDERRALVSLWRWRHIGGDLYQLRVRGMVPLHLLRGKDPLMAPVTKARIATASQYLQNVDTAAIVCRQVGLPFWAACALLEKESGGRNVYGHDTGGVFSRDQHREVTPQNFNQFLIRVMNGETSNGVGPCQITYAGSLKSGHRDGGYFRQMAEANLLPWVPSDNMHFGFDVLLGHKARYGTWAAAGKAYNGRTEYGTDLVKRMNVWRSRLGIKGGPVS